MSLASHSLLGFAFASADLLIEISPAGKITMAIGASEAISGAEETSLPGRNWRDFIDKRDQPILEALFAGLTPGRRGGPVVVSLAATKDGVERAASLSAFCLPENGGAFSCALSRAAPKASHGLQDKADFEGVTNTLIESARQNGQSLELALIDMDGLADVRERLGAEQAQAIDERLSGILLAQSHGGAAAAKLAEERFALVRAQGESTETLTNRIVKLLALAPQDQIRPQASSISLSSAETGSPQVARAIRHALDNFINEGLEGVPSGSLDDAITQAVKQTLGTMDRLQQALKGRDFRLIYQPVVDLKNRSVLHHYEVLVRFGDDASPFPMIRMAEELDMIQALDMAVIERTISALQSNPKLHLAANVSGRTIVNADFIGAVKRLLAKYPAAKKRLMFEVTESAAIDDLGLADRHLQVLRGEGCKVCLDDFGAGAASLAYLQHLRLDIVKIDGRFIRDLQNGGRPSTFIKHLVQMCAELGVKTLAEMVETPEAEEAVLHAGVDYAQGWLYGAGSETPQPLLAPPLSPMAARSAARRTGAVEGWR